VRGGGGEGGGCGFYGSDDIGAVVLRDAVTDVEDKDAEGGVVIAQFFLQRFKCADGTVEESGAGAVVVVGVVAAAAAPEV